MKRKQLGTRNRILLSIAGLGLVAVTWWMLADSSTGTTYAVVLTFTVAVLTLAVATFGTPWQLPTYDHAQLVAAARDLARDVGTREGIEQQKFLADTGVSKPANIGYMQPELISWRIDGGLKIGSLTDIRTFYDILSLGRLVILGNPGAGKTVLANQLLLDIIHEFLKSEPESQSSGAVPVRLSISSFDPGDNPQGAQPGLLSSRLDAWIAHYLTDAYGLPPRIARVLVQKGWILPVLDGLDEVDIAEANPTHAAAVIRALNYPVGGVPRPVVITCRTDRYEKLTEIQTVPGRDVILQDATVIRIQSLTATQITDYLTHRFPDPVRKGYIQPRWQPLLNNIINHPDGAVAEVLSSPLRLFLVTTAYHSSATRPARLICMSSDELDDHLFSQFIPAIVI